MSDYQVTIESSGQQFTVPEGETILDAAIHQGIGLPYGCRSGNCGSCSVELVEGEVGYDEELPDEWPNDVSCLACQAKPESDIVIRVDLVDKAAEIEVKTLPCKVERKVQLAHDVMQLDLKLPDNQRLQFMAGQYLDFILPTGHKRAFSIANAPHDDDFIELHVRHVEGGKFTEYVFHEMTEKTVLRIEAPLGTFVLREESERPILLVGGGTGFAPLKGMIEHAFYIGIDRPITLYWGVRSERDLYMPELPQQWAQDHENFSAVSVLSEPDEGWEGRSGFVHEAIIEDIPNIADYDVYMAGPPVMVEAAVAAFELKGLSRDHMFSDVFEYAAPKGK